MSSVVVIGSIFRDAESYLDRYFWQASALARLGVKLRYVLVEGDSVDNTWSELARRTKDLDAVLIKRSHGGPCYGSVDLPARWKQSAFCCNGVLEAVRGMEDMEALVFIESDLIWNAPDVQRLLIDVTLTNSAVAAMCFKKTEDGSEIFYDIWGHVGSDGINFTASAPFHPSLEKPGLIEVDSAGSCIVMTGGLARTSDIVFGETDSIKGLCRTIRYRDRLFLDPTVRVFHP